MKKFITGYFIGLGIALILLLILFFFFGKVTIK